MEVSAALPWPVLISHASFTEGQRGTTGLTFLTGYLDSFRMTIRWPGINQFVKNFLEETPTHFSEGHREWAYIGKSREKANLCHGVPAIGKVFPGRIKADLAQKPGQGGPLCLQPPLRVPELMKKS